MDHKLEKAIQAFKSGNDRAFEILYEASKKRVYYTLLSLLKRPQDIEDVMQETYLKVVENIHRYQADTHFIAWVNQIARRTALDFIRKDQHETNIEIADFDERFAHHEAYEDRYFIQKLLKSLDPIDQEIVIRKTFLQQKHKDIAKALDLPLGTVTWRYQQALARLRSEVSDVER